MTPKLYATLVVYEADSAYPTIVIRRGRAFRTVPTTRANLKKHVIGLIVALTNAGYEVDDQTNL